MGYLLKIALLENETFVRIFNFFTFGFLHPKGDKLKVKGLMVGFWKFQLQLTLAYDNRTLEIGETVYEA